MNKFICIGRLTRDVELNSTNSGIFVAKFSMAVDRKFKNENGEKMTDFFNIVAWRGLAENISKYCKKGSKVCIAGELQNRSWDDNDGNKRYITEVIASECEFLDNKNAEQEPTETNSKTTSEEDLPF